MSYDYLIVGSGLYGAVFAHEALRRGKRVLVVEKRGQAGGNIACAEREGIPVHLYGAHIFHTSDPVVWEFVNRFVSFNSYINSPIANFHGELYNLPFNMNTFHAMWGVNTPAEAKEKIAEQRREARQEPRNLAEQAVSLVGQDIFEKLIRGYTEKQWGRVCEELPAFIIKRLPVRYTYDNNYFNDRYQGIPVEGYNVLIRKLLAGAELVLDADYLAHRTEYRAAKVVYTGAIDAYFDYALGELAYRSLRFETERLEQENYQGVAVMNFTAREVPYTRVIEHKHFVYGTQPVTYVTREYPADWQRGDEAYYPVNDEQNQALYRRYLELAEQEKNVIFGGRLAEYRYYNMDQVIAAALQRAGQEME